MLSRQVIKKRLEKIYSQIPSFDCKHCHQCEGPIIWFEPEEIMIREFLKNNNMKYTKWTKEQFEKNKNKCPYLKKDRCSIYEVRPIVCRLQGVIPDLPCKYNNKILMSGEEVKKVKKEMEDLLREMDAVGVIYSTKKYQ